ncbi:MAG TPA: hypothetical protein VGH42_12365 [Verrucomicrobiae bacterium]
MNFQNRIAQWPDVIVQLPVSRAAAAKPPEEVAGCSFCFAQSNSPDLQDSTADVQVELKTAIDFLLPAASVPKKRRLDLAAAVATP